MAPLSTCRNAAREFAVGISASGSVDSVRIPPFLRHASRKNGVPFLIPCPSLIRLYTRTWSHWIALGFISARIRDDIEVDKLVKEDE